ncbi:glycosyltransferase family 2 protein [Salinimonas chungwhensis]|uniref:glycosyltransferase family 2 protein n=1 Tax=Salinimonas chungwhensis TaxID=265425 RepID=UPI0003607D6E|nr:galactosyltransferase-related protein [Salinimonas chungwhensis]
MHQEFSVVTIVKGRIRQLTNLIKSIEKSNVLPAEFIVVWMASPCSESLITSKHFAIQHKFVANDQLPIPRARNKGLASALSSHIVYLDVDCICGADTLARMVAALQPGRVVTTQIAHLQALAEHTDYERLAAQTVDQLDYPGVPLETDISMSAFHTTAFALHAEDFNRTGGFDESYSGFGVGDVDFAARCETSGIHLYILPDKILRQFHPRVEPPINHLSDIVHNAAIFKRKWGTYPVKNWLNQFADEGLINDDFNENGLKVRRLPTKKEISEHMIYTPDY